MKKIIKRLLVIGSFIFFIYYVESHKNKRMCNIYNRYLAKSLNGIVVKKMIDLNDHSFPYVYINNVKQKHNIEKLDLTNDTSAYNLLEVNDSIIKFENDPWLYKIKNKKIARFVLVTCGCIKKGR